MKASYSKLLIGFVSALLLAGPVGCATDNPQVNGDAGYAKRAEALYRAGKKLLEKEKYKDAIKMFRKLEQEHPYSQYAALATLGIADTYFEQGKHRTAVEEYRSFVQLHSGHDKVAYARYRIGQGYVELMPETWFLQPPAYERDLSMAKKAVGALNTFLKRHKKSEFVDEAKSSLEAARTKLANHELAVAEFYIERNKFKAAKLRLEYLLDHYGNVGVSPKAMFLLARCSIELGHMERAKATLESLLESHPDTQLAQRAESYLQRHQL